MLASGLYVLLAGVSAVTSLLGKPPANSQDGPPIFFGSALKEDLVPFLVIHKPLSLPAGQTLDGVSDLIDGEIQFDSYANDQITAQKLSRVVRDALKNYGGALSDGTTIQFTEVTAELDDGYEEGGQGYLFRSLVRLKAMYTEGS
jgi:hypothetical protein